MRKGANYLFVLTAVSCITAAGLCMFSHKTAADLWQRSEGTLLPMDKLQEREAVPVERQPSPPEPALVPVADVPRINQKNENQAASAAAVSEEKEIKKVPLQLQYLPTGDAFIASHGSKVNGVAIGYFLAQKDITGVSVALSHMNHGKVNGVSFSLFDESGELSGVAFSMIGKRRDNRGVAVGLWNIAENNHFWQLGLFNHAERAEGSDRSTSAGEQAEKSFGIQTGLINNSDSAGIQFGLWNYNPNSWIKGFPIFNICF